MDKRSHLAASGSCSAVYVVLETVYGSLPKSELALIGLHLNLSLNRSVTLCPVNETHFRNPTHQAPHLPHKASPAHLDTTAIPIKAWSSSKDSAQTRQRQLSPMLPYKVILILHSPKSEAIYMQIDLQVRLALCSIQSSRSIQPAFSLSVTQTVGLLLHIPGLHS